MCEMGWFNRSNRSTRSESLLFFVGLRRMAPFTPSGARPSQTWQVEGDGLGGFWNPTKIRVRLKQFLHSPYHPCMVVSTYIYHKESTLNVGKYIIHGSYGKDPCI